MSSLLVEPGRVRARLRDVGPFTVVRGLQGACALQAVTQRLELSCAGAAAAQRDVFYAPLPLHVLPHSPYSGAPNALYPKATALEGPSS